MHLKNLPESYEAFERFNLDYERALFQQTEHGQRVGTATRELFASWFPAPIRPLVRQAMHALMDDATLQAFGFPPPSPGFKRAILDAMRLRALVLRLLPSRRKPRLRTQMRHRSYGPAYRLEQIGPPYMQAETKN
jgi:hypothetical protein